MATTVSRRALLGTGAVALVVGSGATELPNALAGSPAAADGGVEPPGEMLMNEHGVLKRILLIYRYALEQAAAGRSVPLTEVRQGAQIIHDYIEGFHEALEEGYVFPRLKAAGTQVPTVETLLLQHARGRQLTQRILSGASGLTGALGAFVTMYEPHEAREDTVIFPAYRSLLSASDLEEVGKTFAQLQREQFGPDGFASVVRQVAAIEQQLGIYDLDRFTPPATTP